MLSSSLDGLHLQQNYFESLLYSHSPQALKVSEYVEEQNQKYQNQIAEGKLVVAEGRRGEISGREGEKREEERLRGSGAGYQSQRYSRSNRQSPEGRVISREEHGKILRHIVEQKRSLNLQKEIRRREMAIEAAKEQAVHKQLLEQMKLQKQIEKKKNLQQRINLMNDKKEKRKLQIREQNRVVQKILNQNRLYQKLEKNYLKQEAVEMEEKKKKLAEIRQMHKPVTKQELLEHQKKIIVFKERISKNPVETNDEGKLRSSSLVQVYKSDFYKKAIEQNKERTKKIQKQKQQRLQHAYLSKQKIKQYQKHIRDHFKPIIDDRLVQQLQNQNTVDIRKALGTEDLKQIGQDYLKFNLANRRQKQKEKPVSEPIHSTNTNSFEISKEQNSENLRVRAVDMRKVSITERLRINKSSKNNHGVMLESDVAKHEEEGEGQHQQRTTEMMHLRTKQLLDRKRSKSQIEDDLKHIRKREQNLNEIMDEGELDKLYEKIMSVKMEIGNKKG